MVAAADGMKAMRARRRARGLREVRLVPDPGARSVRERIAAQVTTLGRGGENDALNWIEAVSEFDEVNVRGGDAAR